MAALQRVAQVWALDVDGELPLPYLQRELAGWKGVRSATVTDDELKVEGSVLPAWCVVFAVLLFPLGLLLLLSRQQYTLSIRSDGDAAAPTAVVTGWVPEDRAGDLARLRLVVAPAA